MSLILSGTDGLSDVDGSAATPAIRGTDTNTGIFFPAADTIAFSESGVECMRIDSAGNLGLGVTPKTYSLGKAIEVGFAGNGINGASQTQVSFIGNAYYNGNWKYGGTGKSGFMQIDNGAILWYNTDTSGTADNNITGFSERARIDTSGKLLVATTSVIDGARMTIKGSATVINAQTETDGSYVLRVTNAAGSGVGGVVANSSSTSYLTSSDYRLKNTIAPMTGALTKVALLKPVTYKWNADGSDGEGFIAHELAAVCPDAVCGAKDAVDADGNPQYQGIDVSFLVATLTAAIQEQQAIITQLTERITALEGA